MPYIEGSRRTPLREMVDEVAKNCGQNSMAASACCAAIATIINPPQIIAAGLSALIEELRSRTSDQGSAEDGHKVSGDVNYCISRLIYKFLNMVDMSYARCILGKEVLLVQAESIVARLPTPNKAAGFATLRLVARELDRRFGANYENEKMKLNGDFTD